MPNIDWSMIYWTGFAITLVVTFIYNLVTGFNFFHLLIDIFASFLWPIAWIYAIFSIAFFSDKGGIKF